MISLPRHLEDNLQKYIANLKNSLNKWMDLNGLLPHNCTLLHNSLTMNQGGVIVICPDVTHTAVMVKDRLKDRLISFARGQCSSPHRILNPQPRICVEGQARGKGRLRSLGPRNILPAQEYQCALSKKLWAANFRQIKELW